MLQCGQRVCCHHLDCSSVARTSCSDPAVQVSMVFMVACFAKGWDGSWRIVLHRYPGGGGGWLTYLEQILIVICT